MKMPQGPEKLDSSPGTKASGTWFLFFAGGGGGFHDLPREALHEFSSSRLKNGTAFNTVFPWLFSVCLQTACTKKLKRRRGKKKESPG